MADSGGSAPSGGFGVDTGHVGQLSSRLASEEGPAKGAAHKLSDVYGQVHADHGKSFDTQQHWAQVNNALSEASQALDDIAKAVGNVADGLSKTAHGYADTEGNLQDAYKKALTELPVIKPTK